MLSSRSFDYRFEHPDRIRIREALKKIRIAYVCPSLRFSVIVLTSLYLFDIYKEVTIMDPMRMIIGVVTSVGFLCAGTIMRRNPVCED